MCAVCALMSPGDVLAVGLTCRELAFVLREDVAVWRPLLLHRWDLEGEQGEEAGEGEERYVLPDDDDEHEQSCYVCALMNACMQAS
jgi:hypothetical protein